jgi:hypothetical protein
MIAIQCLADFALCRMESVTKLMTTPITINGAI